MYDAVKFPIVQVGLRTVGHSDIDGARHVPKTYGVVPAGATYVLTSNGGTADAHWARAGSGSGTVTSVGLSMPGAVFSVAGSPVTTSGTLSVSLNSQAANLVFASPNGSSGVPAFRSLVLGDMAAIPANTILGNNTGSAATPAALTVSQAQALLGVSGGPFLPLAAGAANPLTGELYASQGVRVGAHGILRDAGSWGALYGGGVEPSSTNWILAWRPDGSEAWFGASSLAGFAIADQDRIVADSAGVLLYGSIRTPLATGFVRSASGTLSASALVAGDLPGTFASDTTGSAARWTTARTLTIGSTGKTVDGSTNVSWSLAEIGAAPAFTSGAAGLVWATPAATAGVPLLRALVASDIPTLNQNTTGSSAKWTTARSISMTGDVTWSVSVDGSANATATGTLASIITAGGPIGSASVVPVVTWDAKGRLASVSSATITPAAIGALSLAGGTMNTGAQILTNKDITPSASSNTNYAAAPLVAQRASNSGTTTVAAVGFHNLGVNAAALYYDAATSVFRYNRHTGDIVTIWDASNLTNLSQLTNGPGYVTNATVANVDVTEHSANNINYPIVWDNGARALFHTAAKLTFNPSLGSLISPAISATTLLAWPGASFRDYTDANYTALYGALAGTPGSSNYTFAIAKNGSEVYVAGSSNANLVVGPTIVARATSAGLAVAGALSATTTLGWGAGAAIGSSDNVVQGYNGSGNSSISGSVAMSSWRRSGFYAFSTPTDAPNSSGNWTHLIHSQGADWAAGSHYTFQIASSFSGGANTGWGAETYAMRVVTGGTPQPWRRLWHDGNLTSATLPGGPYLPKAGTTGDFGIPISNAYIASASNLAFFGRTGYWTSNPVTSVGLTFDGSMAWLRSSTVNIMGDLYTAATFADTDIQLKHNTNVSGVLSATSFTSQDASIGGMKQVASRYWSTSSVLPVMAANTWCFLVCDFTGGTNVMWTTNSTQTVTIRSGGNTYTTAVNSTLTDGGANFYANYRTMILVGPTVSTNSQCSVIVW